MNHTNSMTVYVAGLIGALIYAASNNVSMAMSLQTAVQKAVAEQPKLLMSVFVKKQAEAQCQLSNAGLFPHAEVNIAYGRQKAPIWQTDGKLDMNVGVTPKVTTLRLRQMLFDGFATISQVEASKARLEEAKHNVQAILEENILAIAEAYLSVLRGKSIVEYAKDNLNLHQELLARTQPKNLRQAEKEQVAARLALARTTLLEAQSMLRDAHTRFAMLTGFELNTVLRPELSKHVLPVTEESLIKQAIEHSNLLDSAHAAVTAAQAERKQALAGYYPELDLSLNRQQGKNFAHISKKQRDTSVMLQLRYNVFMGGADQAREKLATWRLEEAKQAYTSAQREVESKARLAWTAYTQAHGQLGFFREYTDKMQAAAQHSREQCLANNAYIAECLDAQLEAYSACSMYISSQLNELLGGYKLLYSTNHLSKHFHINVPDLK